MASTSARPLVGYAITYAIGDIVYGTPRLSGNTRPYAADKELGVVTAVEDAERHMVLWLSGDFNDLDDNSSFVVEDQPVERPCRRSDLSRKAKTVQLPAAWSNDVPQALDAPAAAQRLVVAGEETLFTRGDVARLRGRAAAQAARGRGLNRPERERSAPRKLEQEQPLLRLEWEASAKQQAAKKRRQMQDAATPSPAVAPPPAEEEVEEVEEVEDGSPAAASPASAVVDLEGAGGGGDDDDEVQFVSEAQSPEREAKRQQKWEQLKELVAAKGYDADAVLDGWVVRVERRRNGGTQGQMDTYFDAPGRKKLRSFNDVYEYLLQLHGVGAGPSSSASTAAGATPAEEWQTDHDLVGRKVRRFDPSFPGETFNGTIVGWDPTGFQDEPPEPLFHVRHDDGDEEDLEEHEAEEAIAAAKAEAEAAAGRES